MGHPAQKLATYADLFALPPSVKGEILDGVLYTHPRPRFRHAKAASFLDRRVGGPFMDGDDGPGGWWILVEPGIEFPGSPEVSPDLAGWRRERMPEPPEDESITVVPDWVCEILSPSTRNYDQRIKKAFYAKHGVPFLWIVDPEAHIITASRLENGRWLEIGVFGADKPMRAEPFEAIEIDLSGLWEKPKDETSL